MLPSKNQDQREPKNNQPGEDPLFAHTFINFPGIGPTYEKNLKESGFNNWTDFTQNPEAAPVPLWQRHNILEGIAKNRDLLARGELTSLIESFPSKERWRFLHSFRKDLSFLDCETTGLNFYRDEMTMAGLHHKGKLHLFTRNDNLDELLSHLEDVKVLVTFCGSHFDVPHILDEFRIPELPCAHIDLRWACYHLGLKGGLKLIEKQIGIKRESQVTGMEAVDLWYAYEDGDESALHRLRQYLSEDVLGLIGIVDHILSQHTD